MDLAYAKNFIAWDSLSDNIRLGIERRNFSYSIHIPERRSGLERRSSDDRQNQISSYFDNE